MQLIDNIHNETKTVKWLYDQTKEGLLFVDDSFQRRYVWTTKNQIQLVESILIGYPVPEIYVWERDTDPDTGNSRLSIIDGQQRLGAINEFLNDKFRLEETAVDKPSADYAGKFFSELAPSQRSDVWKYRFVVRFVKNNVSREDIVEMFLRLNKTNTSLNPQELRNAAFDGKFLELAQKISENEFWQKYSIFNVMEVRRMLDIQFISEILIFFRFGFKDNLTQENINKAYDTFNKEYQDAESDRILFEKIIAYAKILFDRYPGSVTLFKKKNHLYTLFTVLYYFYVKYNNFPEDSIIKYGIFAEGYNSIETLEFYFNDKMELIGEYKGLVLEGTKKKTSLQRRFDIMKNLTDYAD